MKIVQSHKHVHNNLQIHVRDVLEFITHNLSQTCWKLKDTIFSLNSTSAQNHVKSCALISQYVIHIGIIIIQ